MGINMTDKTIGVIVFLMMIAFSISVEVLVHNVLGIAWK
jgi:hypothetical protein